MSEQLITLEKENVELYEFQGSSGEVTDAGIPSLNAHTRIPTRNRQPQQGGCEWIAQAMRQLQAIAQLPDGWDSHGAGRPDARTIRSARLMLAAMASNDATLAAPRINPTPSGGVQCDWESGSRYFEIELIDRWTAHYYFADHQLQIESEGELRAGDSLTQMLDYVRRVGTEP